MVILALDEHGGPPEAPFRLTAITTRRGRPALVASVNRATREEIDRIVRVAFQRERA